MPTTITLTWLGDRPERVKACGANRVLVPGKVLSFSSTNDTAALSAKFMAFARLGLFKEINPAVVPGSLGSTPIVTAVAATSPQPYATATVRPPYLNG